MIEARRNVGEIDVVSLTGSLDVSVAQQLSQELKASIDGGRPRIVLDLQNVRFVDSSGLSVLVSVLKSARRQRGDVVLLHLPDSVRPVIQLTRLDRTFTIVGDEESALRSFSVS